MKKLYMKLSICFISKTNKEYIISYKKQIWIIQTRSVELRLWLKTKSQNKLISLFVWLSVQHFRHDEICRWASRRRARIANDYKVGPPKSEMILKFKEFPTKRKMFPRRDIIRLTTLQQKPKFLRNWRVKIPSFTKTVFGCLQKTIVSFNTWGCE